MGFNPAMLNPAPWIHILWLNERVSLQ